MEMRKVACAVLVVAVSATSALAAEAPAPGPASASFAVTPAVGAAIGASVLSFFAFYLQNARMDRKDVYRRTLSRSFKLKELYRDSAHLR
ncbi:hypothetical protein B296_00018457 [Ensete ventricosum]|uniref:Uncharacterized protein n=1 Tax=Ensete ventricosum TaxID=4639 RepID=A0A426ZHT6_ENSVE|nr:hypothetical protein B296_00018457 [Ensete ventricosum]